MQAEWVVDFLEVVSWNTEQECLLLVFFVFVVFLLVWLSFLLQKQFLVDQMFACAYAAFALASALW